MSFKKAEKDLQLSLGTVWLMNSMAEHKGRQELYERQSPQILKVLVEMALIESAESSNRIEGVTIQKQRLKPLIIGHSKPRDRSEEEVAGYRKALDIIHNKYNRLEITPQIIKDLHRVSHAGAGDAGQWKKKNNEIIKKNPDGTVEIIFKPVSPEKTPEAIKQLCLAYRHSVGQQRYPDLYAIACLILDFLCIHPFRDGNGRVSRLLTLLALYHHGYKVGKYISLERIIEQSKDRYYESLQRSSHNWHTTRHEITPWLNYFLGIIESAYVEFEQRAGKIKTLKGAKTGVVIKTINNQLGEFSISGIEKECAVVSRDMIRLVFRQLQKEKKIKCLGKGQSAKWIRLCQVS